MYIKNGSKKYQCTDFSGKSTDDSILFYLASDPKLSDDKIELYTDTDFLLKDVSRSEYKYESVKPFGEQFILSLFNEEETVADINTLKSDKIKDLSAAAQAAIETGFSINIDDEQKHFSCETHDQQNISSICQYLSEHEDVEGYLYHADGEAVTMFERDVLFNIRDIMLQHISECVKKYNELREKVYAAKTEDEVREINFNNDVNKIY